MKFMVVLVYVVMVLLVGYQSMRKTKTVSDYFLGGRNVGPWVSAFAYGTTYFSAVLFIGYAGKIGWGFGLSSLWIVVGNSILGTFLAWKFLARRTREMTIRLGALTMPQFLERRYQSVNLKILSALIIFVFLVPYSASVYMGLSYLFEEVFGIPFVYALFAMAALTACYLVMGGYTAVTLTDLIQGLVMIFGVVAMLFFVVKAPQVGSISAAFTKLHEIDPKLVHPIGPPGIVPLASLVVLTSLGPWGLPQMIQKFYAIKSEQAIKPAMVVSTSFALIITFGAYFTGSLGRLFFPDGMPQINGVPNPDVIIPGIISTALPEAFQVLILLLVLAASMSTLASLVLVASSSIGIDLLGTVAPEFAKKRGVAVMRLLCMLFIAFSVYIAIRPNVIVNLMSISWGTIAGAFLAPYLYGLFWPKVTKAGAWAGVLSGLFISVGISYFTGLHSSYIPLISSLAIVVPLAVVPLVSLITEKFPVWHMEKVFGATDAKSI
ncbi:MAG: solute:Na+ symporter, family [Clostridia bacterium]|nr:solute:Na+ symporter, family [Clostridia bacterium]